MKAETYQKIYERYLDKYEVINKEVKTGFCRFRDIAANLLSCDIYISDNPDDRKKFFVEIKALRDYFRLLDKYPEFREDELSKLEGHFPEFSATLNEAANFDYQAEGFSNYLTHYVDYSKRRLEDIAKDS